MTVTLYYPELHLERLGTPQEAFTSNVDISSSRFETRIQELCEVTWPVVDDVGG